MNFSCLASKMIDVRNQATVFPNIFFLKEIRLAVQYHATRQNGKTSPEEITEKRPISDLGPIERPHFFVMCHNTFDGRKRGGHCAAKKEITQYSAVYRLWISSTILLVGGLFSFPDPERQYLHPALRSCVLTAGKIQQCFLQISSKLVYYGPSSAAIRQASLLLLLHQQ